MPEMINVMLNGKIVKMPKDKTTDDDGPIPHTGNSMGKGMTNKGMKSGTSLPKVATDKDYLGYGFDLAVRAGVDRANAEFERRIANLDEGRKRTLRARFKNEIANQESLREAGRQGEKEVLGYREAAKAGTNTDMKMVRRLHQIQGLVSYLAGYE